MRYYPGDVHQPVPGLQKSRLAATGGLLMTHIYLAAHHEISGRPASGAPCRGYRAGRGLLAELITAPAPAVTLDRGYMLPLCGRNGDLVARYARPEDLVSGLVLDLVPAPQAPTAAGQVQGALAVRDPRRARLRTTLLQGRRAQRPLPL